MCMNFAQLSTVVDFTESTITIEVPAYDEDGMYEVPNFFRVIDDDINENEELFSLVAEIEADDEICFQDRLGGGCFTEYSTTIIILDNDGMFILCIKDKCTNNPITVISLYNSFLTVSLLIQL